MPYMNRAPACRPVHCEPCAPLSRFVHYRAGLPVRGEHIEQLSELVRPERPVGRQQ